MLPGRRRLRESPTRWALLEPITPRDRICLRTREIGNFCNRSPFARDSGSLADAALGCSAAPRREWLRLPQWERIDATEEPGTRSPCSTPRALLRRDHRPHGAPPPLWPLAAQPLGAQPPAPHTPNPHRTPLRTRPIASSQSERSPHRWRARVSVLPPTCHLSSSTTASCTSACLSPLQSLSLSSANSSSYR